MARITVEDCLEVIPNRFALISIASQRSKQILAGSKVLIDETKNRAIVTSLREIAAGKITTELPASDYDDSAYTP